MEKFLGLSYTYITEDDICKWKILNRIKIMKNISVAVAIKKSYLIFTNLFFVLIVARK